MTLTELIIALKHELKHGGGDRELRPGITVAEILAPKSAQEAVADALVVYSHDAQTTWNVLEGAPDTPGGTAAPPIMPAATPRRRGNK